MSVKINSENLREFNIGVSDKFIDFAVSYGRIEHSSLITDFMKFLIDRIFDPYVDADYYFYYDTIEKNINVATGRLVRIYPVIKQFITNSNSFLVNKNIDNPNKSINITSESVNSGSTDNKYMGENSPITSNINIIDFPNEKTQETNSAESENRSTVSQNESNIYYIEKLYNLLSNKYSNVYDLLKSEFLSLIDIFATIH